MPSLFSLLGTYILFTLWQSTFWLAAAWLAGKFFRRSPCKAHHLYVLGTYAAVLTPILSTVIAFTDNELPFELPFTSILSTFIAFNWQAGSGWVPMPLELSHLGMPQWMNIPTWLTIESFGMVCFTGMAFFMTFLLVGIVASRKLMFHAIPFPDKESQQSLLKHSKTLRNDSLPVLFMSPNITSPTVWCWGLHPAVLLPESFTEKLHEEQRDAVFLHELSHIRRRDHLTSLWTRIRGAALFWNPLYWLVLWQSDLAADESCDQMVLSHGSILPEQYANTLLRFVAGERTYPMLRFLSRKEKIMRRIKQIMQFTSYPTASPDSGIDSSRLDLSRLRPSRLWRASVFVTVLLCCAVLALCQEGKEGASEQILRAAVAHHSGINSYSVNKRLADFPENPGSETPENAYAKMMLDTDANIVKEVDIQTYKDTTRILEVMTKENCACVFAYKERYDMVSNAYEITPEGAFTPVHEADIVKGTPVPMYEAAIFHKQKDQWILDFSMMSSSLEGLTGNVVESEFFGKEPKFIVDGEFIANGDIAESVEKHHAEPVRPEELTEKQRKEYMNSLRIHLVNRTAELKKLEMQCRFILSGRSTEEQRIMLADLNKRAIDLNQMVTYYLDDYQYLLSIIVTEEEKKYMERLSERTSNIEAGLTRLLEWIDQQWKELEGKSGENTQRSPSVESEQRKINTELNARMSRLEEMLKNLETQRQSPSDAALPIAPVEIQGDS